MLLPGIVINHEEEDIGEGVQCEIGIMGAVCELGVLFQGHFEVVLVESGHVGILFLGLDVAAVACVGRELQMSRKE